MSKEDRETEGKEGREGEREGKKDKRSDWGGSDHIISFV